MLDAGRNGSRLDPVDELSALYRLTDRLYRAREQREVYDAALDAILDTLDCDRASVLLFNDEGVMEFVRWRGLSDDYRTKLRGHSPWIPGGRDPQPIFVSDIDDTPEPEWIKATIRKENIRALAFIPLVADGEVVGKFMTYYAEPRIFAEHEIELAVTIARQVGFSLERARAEARRRAAENELRESEERFRLMSENAPVMIWMSDAQGGCLHLNRMLREFWGTGDNLADFNWQTTMHPDDADDIGRQIYEALIKRKTCTITGRYKSANGDYHVLQTDARPRHSSTGEFLGMIGVNIDISERKRADAQRELLLAELNHRVKNTLAVVQAMAYQTFRSSDVGLEARQAFENRLVALASAHNLLTESSWESASVEDIATETLYAKGPYKDRVDLSGPRVLLPPREALAIAMALHELFTNAVKYGALANDTGRLRLDWHRTESRPPRLTLNWRESGGPTVAKPERRGFGSVLLERSLQQDLGGTVTLDFRPDGLICAIETPFPELG
ncbi:MAG TPA: HWE histidine kinase domain-containing protein [Pseudolabrys sp.]|nr:HWE histidine kinase domain-containing protein [Pseudolabrys sp.]